MLIKSFFLSQFDPFCFKKKLLTLYIFLVHLVILHGGTFITCTLYTFNYYLVLKMTTCVTMSHSSSLASSMLLAFHHLNRKLTVRELLFFSLNIILSFFLVRS